MTTCLSVPGSTGSNTADTGITFSPASSWSIKSVVVVTNILDTSKGYFADFRTGETVYFAQSASNLSSNGTLQVNGTSVSAVWSSLPSNAKSTIRIDLNTPTTGNITLFSRYAGSSLTADYLKAYVYDVQLLDASSNVIAHFDLTTGTMHDSSGNGNNAVPSDATATFTWADDGTGSTGTNPTITSVIANSTASSLPPSLTTQKQVSVSGVVANANASGVAPSASTTSSVSVNISGIAATSTASALNPSISTDRTIQGSIASASAQWLSPQVGSFTNVNISATAPNATAGANVPSVATTRNINLVTPATNASASAFMPSVGLSKSATIAAVVASLLVDGIAPSISTTQGTIINAVTAGVVADSIKPTVNTDMIISAIVAGLQASGIAPNVNGKVIISGITLKGNQQLNVYLMGKQGLNVNLLGRQDLNVNLKGVSI